MKFKARKVFSSLFIVMLIFSLFAPVFAAAPKYDTADQHVKVDQKLEAMKQIVGEHERLLERKPTIAPSLLRSRSADTEVEVIVQFSEAPVALAKGKQAIQHKTMSASEQVNTKKKVQNQHKTFEKFTNTHNISYTEMFSYDTVLNGMAIKVKRSDLQALLDVPGIISIEPNSEVYALETPSSKDEDETVGTYMDQTVPHLEIPTLWDRGITGEGVKVAVIDTGIDYHHPDLKDIYKGGYNFVDHSTGVYTTERAEDDPYETYPSERPEGTPEFNTQGSSFYTSHGTHVAGTIAAQGENEFGIKGIAPDIELYAYRVLGAYGSGSISSIIAAVEKAVEEDMDIINLSLGGGSNAEYSLETVAINNATLDGVTAVIATGNAGPGRGTIGTPATAPLAISVGNSTAPEELIQSAVHIQAGDFTLDDNMHLMAWEYGKNPDDVLTGKYDIVAIPNIGTPADFEGIDVEGKVALIARGDIAFVEKIYAAKDAGAIGVLIHNNVDTGPADVFLSSAFTFIPAYDMATEDGVALRTALETNEGTVSFSNFESSLTAGDEMSPTSSQGPSTPNFDIKPDVVAPGSNIMSTVPAYLKDFPEASFNMAYDRASGTSMATPHVAAVAALLLSENPDWTPADVKVALSNTATLLDTDIYDVFAQGAGLVQPVAAMDAEAYAYVLDTALSDGEETENTRGTLAFGGIQPNESEAQTFTKEIELRNVSSTTSDYDVTVEVSKNGSGLMADADVTVDVSTVSLSDTAKITATLHVPPGEAEKDNELLGYIHISNGTTNLSLPFAASFDGEVYSDSEIGYAYLDDYAIALDSDGHPSETEFNFQLLDYQNVTYAELWDASNPQGGVYGDGSIGQLGGGNLLEPGEYSMLIDGEYFDYETEAPMQAPDGVYTIDLLTQNVFGKIYTAWDGPFYIKSTNPEIAFDEITEEVAPTGITGTIDDQFIDFKEIVDASIGMPYNVNDHLTATYEITDEEDVVAGEGELVLADDGSFTIPVTGLAKGEYTATLSVVDRLTHSATETITFVAPEVVNVTLTPSTTEPTEAPVTIEVATDSESALTEIKWLDGFKEIADFAEAGETVDLEASAFDVTENGAYTVYVKNENETEAIAFINVQNIGSPDESFTIDVTPSPTEKTAGPVTLDVTTDSTSELNAVKWLKGEHGVDAFAEDGEVIDLDAMAFDVTENAVYTVYAQNHVGAEEVQTVTVTNIIIPDASAFDLSFEQSETEPTEDPVTITVSSTSEADLSSLQWLRGAHNSVEAFETDANDIDLETNAFEVAENGVYTVLAINSEGEMAIDYIEVTNMIVVEEPTPFTVGLTPSTTEQTEGPVTVLVTTDSEASVTVAKWLSGEHGVDAFADNGEAIDLGTMSFDVTENGVYTVYVQNEEGVEITQTISVTNIGVTEPEPEPAPISVTFNLSKSEPTIDPITVGLEVETEAAVTAAKWLPGRVSLDDIRANGNDLSLDDLSFVITENGTYSVYVQNSDGVEVLTTITITNIIPEAPEEPEQPDDPADPQPCVPCEDDEDDNDDDGGDGGTDGDNGNDDSDGDNGSGDNDGNNGSGENNGGDGEGLPKTATNTFNYIAIGLFLTLAGGLTLLIVYRRKQHEPVE